MMNNILVVAFAITAIVTLSVTSYLYGKVDAQARYGEAYQLVMERADYVTALELQHQIAQVQP
jgi:hypothetical protein